MSGNHEAAEGLRLSPSGAHRWLNCHAAPFLERGFPNRDTEASIAGTAGHALAAVELKRRFSGAEPKPGEAEEAVKTLLSVVKSEDLGGYLDAGAGWADTLRTRFGAFQLLWWGSEVPLDGNDMFPGLKGTSDFLGVYRLTETKLMLVVSDLKLGLGKVEAVGNPQLRLYAVMALKIARAFITDDREELSVALHIHQPRIGHDDVDFLSAKELEAWYREEAEGALAEVKQDLASGERHYTPGDWCRWCLANGACRGQRDEVLALMETHDDPEGMTGEEFADVLPVLPRIKRWLKGVEEAAFHEATKGTGVPGWSVADGPGRRYITNPEEAAARIEKLGLEINPWKDPELVGVTYLEKALGEDFGPTLSDLIQVKPGSARLIPVKKEIENLF